MSWMTAGLGALGGLAGLLGNTTGARTSTKNTVTTPTYTAAQTAVQNQEGTQLQQNLSNPAGSPQFASGADTINQSYNGAADGITQQLASRGFGKSGLVGSGLLKVGLARAGSLGNLYSSLQSSFMDATQKFGFASPGSTSDTTAVGAGSELGGALSGGLSTALAAQKAFA